MSRMLHNFPSVFNDCHGLPAAPCNMNATQIRNTAAPALSIGHVASRVSLPKIRPPPDQRRRYAAHHSRCVRLHWPDL